MCFGQIAPPNPALKYHWRALAIHRVLRLVTDEADTRIRQALDVQEMPKLAAIRPSPRHVMPPTTQSRIVRPTFPASFLGLQNSPMPPRFQRDREEQAVRAWPAVHQAPPELVNRAC
jgi:hypothetical protein